MINESNNKKSGKLSLTGSLSALTKTVQEEQEKVNSHKEEQESFVSVRDDSNVVEMSTRWNEVISRAKDLRNNPTKLETIYLYGNIKKDLEILKTVEDFRNIPMAALVSSIIDDFLTNNSDLIRSLLKRNESRF
jgi:hypothetical protein